MSMREVRPVVPVAPYIGGKRNLAARIIQRIETVPHATYAEPFVGMGGVFLRRRLAPPAEVVNDWSRDVATLFRVLQRHLPQFLDTLKFQLTTRADFDRLTATDPATLTDLERAARFLYLQRCAFGGKVAGRNFGVSVGYPGRFNLTTLERDLAAVHERLAGVIIECLPYGEFIRRYDRPDTLFYLDPPYWGSEGDYGKDLFGRPDFAALADQLAGIKGAFLLSINDTPEVRGLFGGFHIQGVDTTYSLPGGGHATRARELIISNRPG
jgi:DNA adenine methylase